jgi:hypothetical protein
MQETQDHYMLVFYLQLYSERLFALVNRHPVVLAEVSIVRHIVSIEEADLDFG